MSDWKEYRLGDIITFTTGKLNSNAAVSNGKYPFFTCAPNPLYINEAAFNQEAVILAGNNAEGNFAINYYKGEFNAYQRTYVFSPNDDISAKFLYYSLGQFLKDFKALSRGTATKFLTATILNSFTLKIPKRTEQDKIAGILSSLDDKIETNRRINARLEELAQALFKSWFIDFEPFGGKMPADWKIVGFNEAVEVISGGTPKTDTQEYWDGNIPWISVKDFVNEPHFVMVTERSITEQGLNSSATHILSPGDTILSARGTVGAIAQIQEPMAFNQSCFGLRSIRENGAHWLYYMIQDKVNELKQKSHGSVFDTINRKTLSDLSVELPPLEVLKSFDRAVSPLINSLLSLSKESARLAALRDTLLPKLMSGEVAVPEPRDPLLNQDESK